MLQRTRGRARQARGGRKEGRRRDKGGRPCLRRGLNVPDTLWRQSPSCFELRGTCWPGLECFRVVVGRGECDVDGLVRRPLVSTSTSTRFTSPKPTLFLPLPARDSQLPCRESSFLAHQLRMGFEADLSLALPHLAALSSPCSLCPPYAPFLGFAGVASSVSAFSLL